MGEMYKSVKEDKSRKNTKNPSFSSTLLDEIYRSIDGVDEKFGEFKKLPKKQSIRSAGAGTGAGRAKVSSSVEDEETASLRRARLVEKWMEMKVNEKVSTGRREAPLPPEFDRRSVLDNDPLFFSSGSSSSDSSFGWFSEPESFNATKPKPKPKSSCFGPFNGSKPVKSPADDEDPTRSKTHLKKVKQPISPGVRLTTFLNSIFTNGHRKKKSKDLNYLGFDEEKRSKSTHGSNCSSASSFSRSCLSKNSPRSREKVNNGVKRTVRFYPVSVIVDQDCRPCGEKIICAEQISTKLRNIDDEDEEYDDEVASDSSSDLFELDHLAILDKDEYGDELPVYETTNIGKNRAIASGLIS